MFCNQICIDDIVYILKNENIFPLEKYFIKLMPPDAVEYISFSEISINFKINFE